MTGNLEPEYNKEKVIRDIKKRFPFGLAVQYCERLERRSTEIKSTKWPRKYGVEWLNEPMPSEKVGIVIGWKWLSNGHKQFCNEDGWLYTHERAIFALEVKCGMTNKVEFVDPRKVTHGPRCHDFRLPERYKQPLTNQARAALSEAMKRDNFERRTTCTR